MTQNTSKPQSPSAISSSCLSLPNANLENTKCDPAGMRASPGTELARIKGIASAEAELSGQQDSVLKLQTVSVAMRALPAGGKTFFGDFTTSQLKKLNPIIERISSIPRLGDSVRCVLEKLGTVLVQ